MSTPILAAMSEQDDHALRQLLAEDVRFNSPVRSYTGRDHVIHLLTTIGSLQYELRATRRLDGPQERATFIEMRAGERKLDGVLDERHDEAGRVVELTLMLRPLSELREAVKRMAEALET